MAKKKKPKTPQFVKYILIGAVVLGAGSFVIYRSGQMMSKLDFFRVHSVTIDPSLGFINKNDLKSLMGKNIFAIDLKSVKRKLNQRYPQASRLKVIRRFPNQIAILAKPRLPFAQVRVEKKYAVLDQESVILSVTEAKDKDLPEISGANVISPRLVLGLPLKGSDLWTALKVMKLFATDESLAGYAISGIDVANMSKILFTMSNKVDVIIDRDDISRKMRILGVVLAQDTLNLNDVKYIDLRFKEPIIGKK